MRISGLPGWDVAARPGRKRCLVLLDGSVHRRYRSSGWRRCFTVCNRNTVPPHIPSSEVCALGESGNLVLLTATGTDTSAVSRGESPGSRSLLVGLPDSRDGSLTRTWQPRCCCPLSRRQTAWCARSGVHAHARWRMLQPTLGLRPSICRVHPHYRQGLWTSFPPALFAGLLSD